VLSQAHHSIHVATRGQGFTDLTREVVRWIGQIRADAGVLTVFVRHTSASLTIQENADPDVQTDLIEALDRAAPRSRRYHHSLEGPDDMPAHIRSMLTATSLSIPVLGGRPLLGSWHALYLIEHRDQPLQREIALTYLGTFKA
jgi:secondary thiamine-phosphate synthase enzyme